MEAGIVDHGIKSGTGGAGTSYSGGAGSGGIQTQTQNQGLARTSGAGSAVGANGGFATMSRDGNWTCVAYGGVGNPNGGDVWGRNSGGFWNGSSYYNGSRPSGTGGLLILYSDNLYNNGTISSNGVNSVCNVYGNWSVGGGASGGGSVNIFSNRLINLGSMTANGGVCTGASYQGGAGGSGTVTIKELGADLIYPEKEITLKTNEEYTINKSELRYLNFNEYQTGEITVGEVQYEILNKDLASIDENGKITAIQTRKNKSKNYRYNKWTKYIYLFRNKK